MSKRFVTYRTEDAKAGLINVDENGVMKETGSGLPEGGEPFKQLVTDADGNTVKSNTVTLSMKTPLTIITQPGSVSVASGERASVRVVAEGEGLKYQWYVKAQGTSTFDKSSITSATYGVTMTSARNGNQVYCVVTDVDGNTVKSNTVTLSMSAGLKITTQPTNVTVANGATAKTTVKATGEGLKYQWYFTSNASDSSFSKSGTTTATYSTEMNADRDGRKVYCVVTDKYGSSVQTNTVTLTLDSEVVITKQPTDVTVAKGQTAKVSFAASGLGLTYEWYYSDDNGTLDNFFMINSTTYMNF